MDAVWEGLRVSTDQDGSAPSPFDLFLASLGTCTEVYVACFCRQRGISMDGLRVMQRAIRDPGTNLLEWVELEIRLKEGFPEKYRTAIVRAAGLCTVKKHLARPPAIGG